MRNTIETPWGPAQTIKELAPGILRVSTASHGGLILSQERQDQIQCMFPDFVPWLGSLKYLEEDCDYVIGIAAFPDTFPEDQEIAWKILKADYSGRNYYQLQDTHRINSEGRLVKLERANG